jgi:hypothetical protein
MTSRGQPVNAKSAMFRLALSDTTMLSSTISVVESDHAARVAMRIGSAPRAISRKRTSTGDVRAGG